MFDIKRMPEQERVAGLARWHQVRRENGYTISSLAKEFNVSRQTMAKWSSPGSKGSPTLYIIMFCEKFNVSLTWLVWGLGPKKLTDFQKYH